MANEAEVLKVLAILGASYPNFELRDDTGEVYCRLLADIPCDLLEAAAIQHIAENRFFPSVAELRELADRIASYRDRRPTALEAWGEVIQQVHSIGSWRKPEFSSPLIARCVECIGWHTICYSEMIAAERARFIEAYDELVKREREERRMLPEVRQLAALMASSVRQIERNGRNVQEESVYEWRHNDSIHRQRQYPAHLGLRR